MTGTDSLREENVLSLNLGTLFDLTGRLVDHPDPAVRELAKAAYEMGNTLNAIRGRLAWVDFGDDADGE